MPNGSGLQQPLINLVRSCSRVPGAEFTREIGELDEGQWSAASYVPDLGRQDSTAYRLDGRTHALAALRQPCRASGKGDSNDDRVED
jgi:hypothetical protein